MQLWLKYPSHLEFECLLLQLHLPSVFTVEGDFLLINTATLVQEALYLLTDTPAPPAPPAVAFTPIAHSAPIRPYQPPRTHQQ